MEAEDKLCSPAPARMNLTVPLSTPGHMGLSSTRPSPSGWEKLSVHLSESRAPVTSALGPVSAGRGPGGRVPPWEGQGPTLSVTSRPHHRGSWHIRAGS